MGSATITFLFTQCMKNIVYFDLETQKSAEEVGGWDKISAMGMSLGVTYSNLSEVAGHA